MDILKFPVNILALPQKLWLFVFVVVLCTCPAPSARAASEALSPLNKLPRHALVIGNSRYATSPLNNPGNDAQAMADHLKRSGFSVKLKLDATRKEIRKRSAASATTWRSKKASASFILPAMARSWHGAII